MLLAHCIATHVFVHLSIRIPVGFTCSDLLQVVDGRVVLGGHSALSGYILYSRPSLAAVRPAATTAIWQNWAGSLDRSVSDRIYSIDMSCREWPWSATSAFFFRRDALNLWVKTPGLADIRRSTDGFFGRAINAVTGSVLIDECLGTLRVHGANNFNKHPQLNNMRNYDLEKDKTVPHRLAILEELTRDPARFPFYSSGLLKNALSAVDTSDQAANAPAWARGSRLSRLLVERYASLAPVFGERGLIRWMFERGIPATALKEAGIRYSFADRRGAVPAFVRRFAR
jgi:hypothetical protein